MNLRWLLILTTVSLLAGTSVSRAEHSNPGDIAVIDLGIAQEKPIARFGRRRVLVQRNGDHWLALIGLPADLLPGEYIVTLAISDDPVTNVPFRVRHRTGNSPLSVTVRELPGTGERQTWPFTDEHVPTPPLAKPVNGDVTETFETGDPAVELAASDGSSVLAPASGIVVEVVSDGPGAQRVRIDHGQGVFSVITPVYDFELKPETRVLTGTRLGVAGAMAGGGQSGIHWAVSMNGVLVDPLRLTLPFKAPEN